MTDKEIVDSVLLSSLISSSFGSLSPVFWKTIGIDPAVAAGPFETAAQDLIGISMDAKQSDACLAHLNLQAHHRLRTGLSTPSIPSQAIGTYQNPGYGKLQVQFNTSTSTLSAHFAHAPLRPTFELKQ
ncbi:hypothetical protein HDU97_007160 [Phlyctochytrium planicorne]|nr:hypothetical protein HDU97_007160 [Phlyctochytrium planicorne]